MPITPVICYNADDVNENKSKRRLYLMIVKITPTENCAVAMVRADNKTNAKVKRIANTTLSEPCLEPPTWDDNPLIFEVANL